jgi:hypothetical protein
MAKADLEELYGLVAEGDTVELVGERNEETAQLFGNGQNPSAAGTVQTAMAAQAAGGVQSAARSAVHEANGTEKANPAVLVAAALVTSL